MAPEYNSKRITHKFDLYSLGVVIIEIVTGGKRHQAVENVLESWNNMLKISKGNAQWEQIRVCAEIGMQCIDRDPAKRPDNMKEIMDRLAATESVQLNLADNPSELLGVHPFALCFPFQSNKDIPCSLLLTNSIDEPVAFRLMAKGKPWASLISLPLYGIVPPRSTYTLVVVARGEKELPQKRIIDVILEGTRLGDAHTQTLERQPNNKYFERARELGNVVQEVSLKAVYTLRRDTMTSSKAISPGIKIMYTTGELYSRCLYSLDANQAKQWIIVGEDEGHVRIWNYHTWRKVDSIKVSEGRVNVRFIARKEWFVAGTNNGYVHVYSYETEVQKITSVKVETSLNMSLAVHPTRSYLLASSGRQMKLWDWDNCWDCLQTFEEEHSETISQVAFNQNDTIATASEDHTVKVWSLDSPKAKYTLSAHSSKVNCLDFFTSADQEYLVTGSDDRTGKIWDLEKRTCVYTLKGFVSAVVSVVYQPKTQTLITGSEDGLVYLWITNNSRICPNYPRLERVIHIGCDGAVRGLACLMGGIVIGKEEALATMDIEQSADDYSENYMMQSGDTTCKLIAPILEVHPLELHFNLGRKKPIMCSLHLKNNTDEDATFRLIDKRGNNHRPQYLAKLPLHGIVPPRSSYMLVVRTDSNTELQEVTEHNLVLQSSILGDKYIVPFAGQSARDDFWGEAKELGHAHEVSIKAIFTRTVLLQEETTFEILDMGKWYERRLHSLDANITKQWIITGGSYGHIGIWNYQTQRKVDSLKLSGHEAATCVKFIARKQWFVAATESGRFHVYNYEPKIEMIARFRTGYMGLVSLAIHPTQPYLLSSHGCLAMELWDWEKDWECIQTFRDEVHYKTTVNEVAFNPKDIIASPSKHHTIKLWSIDSPQPAYTLCGHSGTVNCLDFFTCGDQEYLVSGSDDQTAKIWDMETRICLHTLTTFASQVMYVLYQSNLQILIAGSEDGLIYLWSHADSRICSRSPKLERIIDTGYVKAVRCLAYLTGRVVIGTEDVIGVAIMDVENKNYHKESTDYCEEQLAVYRGPGDTIAKFDVHPLDLRFNHEDHTICSLHLTNKTDEHVAFRVTDESGTELYWGFLNLPIYGTVPPKSTCHLIVTANQDMEHCHPDLVLQSSIAGDNQLEILADPKSCQEFFEDAKELGRVVHEVSLDFVHDALTQRETTFEPVIPEIILFNNLPSKMTCLDAHPTEPWIITGHSEGDICIWNHESKELVHMFKVPESPVILSDPESDPESFKVSESPVILSDPESDQDTHGDCSSYTMPTAVMCVKFDARKQWIVAQTKDRSITVYNCACITQIKKIASFGTPVQDLYNDNNNYSMAIHPTKPYVLSTEMELWDGENGWVCTQKFGNGGNNQVAFNPEYPDTFVAVSSLPEIEVWSLDSAEYFHLSGHSDGVICLAYFSHGDRQYLITGSHDCTAKIWDLQEKECIRTLEGFMSPVIHVIAHTGHQYLVTCSENGTIQAWSSVDFTLKKTINCSGGLVCVMDSTRIAIGQVNIGAMLIMDIDNEETRIQYVQREN